MPFISLFLYTDFSNTKT